MREIGWSSAIPTFDRDSIVAIYQQIDEDPRPSMFTGALPEKTRLGLTEQRARGVCGGAAVATVSAR